MGAGHGGCGDGEQGGAKRTGKERRGMINDDCKDDGQGG